MGSFGTQDDMKAEYERLQSRLRDVVTDIGNLNMSIRTSGSSGEQIKQLYRLREMKADINSKMDALEALIEYGDDD
jgi:hypothetical protein